MAKDLVIVESPAKARTVGRFLGSKYIAKASMGHVRDLPKNKIGVEVNDEGFHPSYRNLPDKKKVILELAKASKEANAVYLATDPDREGEAISWHLIKAAKIDISKAHRVVFHEITPEAIREAFKHPRELNHDLIDAQQARRILDRLVGYRLSPVLWSKVRRGLSAGRVQSVALRLIVDRERENQDFVPREYWNIEATLAKRSSKEHLVVFKAGLRSIVGEKGQVEISNNKHAQDIVLDLDGAGYAIDSVRKRETRSRPAAPFMTSTLQQEASRKLRFTAVRTMQIAQQLYEGLSIGDEGPIGLITYMRTDSTSIASGALQEAAQYIRDRFGTAYAPKTPRLYKRKVKGAQEAHEAIRPTSIMRVPETLRQHLTSAQFRLYDLIWRRMLASQMTDAVFDSTTVHTKATSAKSATCYIFRATGSVVKFPGFRVLYEQGAGDASGDGPPTLPELAKLDPLDCHSLTTKQLFTKPPARYTEATIIRTLEEQGIGRPSTYAPTIATILDRDYVQREGGWFIPTKLGIAVTQLLTSHFPDIMDVGFTARLEEELDDIANGERKWAPVLQDFYAPFDKSIEKAMKEAERVPRDQLDEETTEVCEKCERPMVIKTGRFGRFLSCSGFPECKNSRSVLSPVGVDCPECGCALVQRRRKGKGGRVFYGCSGYPACNFAVNQRPLPQPCPQCSKLLIRSGRSGARCISCGHLSSSVDSANDSAKESTDEAI